MNGAGRRLALLALLLFLSACALRPGPWAHPTKGPEQFSADRYDCIKIAEQSSVTFSGRFNPFITMMEYPKCMREKYGWIEVKE